MVLSKKRKVFSRTSNYAQSVWKKRRYGRKKNTNGSKSLNLKSYTDPLVVRVKGIPWPDEMKVALRYATDTGAWILIGTGSTIYRYAGNSIYDPDIQVGGHKAYGADQFFAIYDKVLVNASKIEASVINNEDRDLEHWVMPLAKGTAWNTDLDEHAAEVTGIKYNWIPPCRRMLAGSPSVLRIGEPQKSVIEYYKTTSGLYVGAVDYTHFTGTSAADPSIVWEWSVGYRGQGQTINYRVELTYYCTFSGRRNVDPSS